MTATSPDATSPASTVTARTVTEPPNYLTEEGSTLRSWLLTHDQWSRLDGPAPSPRGMAAIGYDPERDVVVLYGGFGADAGALADTWQWDGEWRCVDGC